MDRLELAALRILVLAGKTYGAQTLRAVFAIAGLTKVISVDDSRRALELLSMEHYDALFCDEASAPINGRSVPLAVRRSGAVLNPMMPVFVFHERARKRDVEKARDIGASAYITCPISPKTVMTKLEMALNCPRAFIKAPEFFGPDRRALERPVYFGDDRRTLQPRKMRLARMGRELTPI